MDDERVIVGCGCVVADRGRYLLVREAKPAARNRYALPAGKPLLGETLVEAAVREAREEAGLDVEVDALLGVYHCPQTSEGFGVVNFVFDARAVGGELRTSDEHPEVAFFTREAIEELAAHRMLRGTHIRRALDAHARGVRLPPSLLETVPPSALPA